MLKSIVMIKIFTSSQKKLLDSYTIENEPVSADMLMERAAHQCSQWLLSHLSDFHSYKIFAGPGNNGGDGLVIARHLSEYHKKVDVYMYSVATGSSNLLKINLQRLKDQNIANIHTIENKEDFPIIDHSDVILDALFGSGLNKPLTGFLLELINYINESIAVKISIDIPTGLFGEDNSQNIQSAIFHADQTLSFESPFLSFLLAENEEFVGQWHILPIYLHPDALHSTQTHFYLIQANDIVIKKRKKFSHKGCFGHCLLIAGSKGMMGAAVLAARACLRSGTGLLTTHVPQIGDLIIQLSAPESIVSIDSGMNDIHQLPDLTKYSAIGVGCGVGRSKQTTEVINQLLITSKVPLVIDADGLNCLCEINDWQNKIKPGTILTPHPGEFDRLFGPSINGFKRLEKQIERSKQIGIIIVLKGANTSISTPEGNVFFNSTGNAGMAKGGSGDTLTGIILSLLSQGYNALHSVIYGVYLHGLSGDIALAEKSEESLLPSDIIDHLSQAFKLIKNDKNE